MMKKLATALLAVTCITNAQAGAPSTSTADRDRATEGERKPATGKFALTGYIQTQFQWGQQDALLKVGVPNENAAQPFSRFGIRRGRLKLTYSYPVASAVFQLDLTEKGIGIKDAYINISEPWLGIFSLRSGLFDRPFGYEISHSSSLRESPERSTVFQTLFPDERDLGAMLLIKGPSDSPLNILQIRAGLFAGNGIKQESDGKKDFIGQIVVNKVYRNLSVGAGISYYDGFVYQGTQTVYAMKNGGFTPDTHPTNKGKYAKRRYAGFDARLAVTSSLGTTVLRGEYIFGTQPGTATSSKSPNSSLLPGSDTYLRPFAGGYVVLAHDIACTPLSVVMKYDWYDPNTQADGNSLGLNHTGFADLKRSAFGFGALWQVMEGLKLLAYYDIVKNEVSDNLECASADLKDNLFTIRLQYKF